MLCEDDAFANLGAGNYQAVPGTGFGVPGTGLECALRCTALAKMSCYACLPWNSQPVALNSQPLKCDLLRCLHGRRVCTCECRLVKIHRN